jgi:nucleotide-binding universal stress UspA family protein
MIRSLLLALKPSERQNGLIEFVNNLASQHQLLVDGLAVVDAERLTSPEPVPLGGGAFKVDRDQRRLELARSQSFKLTEALQTSCSAKGVTCNAQVCDGDTVSMLTRAAQVADLLVCGHTPGGDASERSLLVSILKHCPRPAIIVPHTTCAGTSTLIAYDGSYQAGRAMASFVAAGLAQGQPVHVLTLHEDPLRAEALAGLARDFLHRHGITPEIHAMVLHGDPGAQILKVAEQVHAGLLVMGAFGLSSVREFFFGSATATILRTLPLPVFIDH